MMTKEVEAKQAPLLAGWAIAAGVAIVAIGVCVVVFGFSLPQAVFVGVVLALVVGLILGMPGKPVVSGQTRDTVKVASPKVLETEIAKAAFAAPGAETIKTAPVKAETAPVAPAKVAAVAQAPAKAAPKKTPAPKAEPAVAVGVGKRPEALKKARGGKADDLKLIKGVGPKLEKLCNTLGFYHFDQIAAWSGDEIAWVDDNLEGFKGRVTRDDWVAQAKVLAAGGETEFSRKSSKG
jgi:predicted flap endonuclease-1-like 5' DNA nuclease